MRGLISIGLVVFAGLLSFAQADCCEGNMEDKCKDGTYCHKWGCCGYGSCNIFCCNCDGGCRKAPTDQSLVARNPLEALEARAQDVMFHSVNTAGDGRMTVDEFLGWATDKYGALTADDIVGFTDKFHSFDRDGSGFLTMEEIDPAA